ncbi:MAG: hypothetical protein KF825_04205 [Ferruginibacter sp.]|nr:hypothetical protein [Ferruginibacter sp.]
MKKIIISFIAILFCLHGVSQQNIPSNKTVSKTIKVINVQQKQFKVSNLQNNGTFIDTKLNELGKIPESINVFKLDTVYEMRRVKRNTFGVFGVGNLNKEQLEKFNASGKFSCYIKPFMSDMSELTFYLSFNKNASNSDSLLAPTLIFPEVGNNSFLGTMEYAFSLKQQADINSYKEHCLVPFFEFSNKSIKASRDTGNAKLASYHFSTLNYTTGLKYLFRFSKTVDSTEHNVDFTLTGYLSYLNIPNQDTADYRILLKSKTVSDNIWAMGIKIGIQYNNFSIFADLRHVLGSDKRIPIRELRGFNSNIGVLFNADILRF